ncbi:hypothetical protein GCM10029978_077940 [Actinoallomurus acanthiterrae]
MIVVVAAAAILILGIAVGAILMVVIAVRREDQRNAGRLPERAPESLTRMARRMNGLYVSRPDSRYRVSLRVDAVLMGDEEEAQAESIVS